jgi:hypothetical protein
VAPHVLAWSGPKGGTIGVGFDDEHFGVKQMQTEIDLMGEAHPDLPDDALETIRAQLWD